MLRDAQDNLISAQAAEIETLRERIRQLEDMLAPVTWRIPPEWRLTGQEAVFFSHLLARDIGTKESLMAALYSDRIDEPERKIVDVFVCKIRKKVAPHGVKIATVWGRGYRLEDRERWCLALAGNAGAAA